MTVTVPPVEVIKVVVKVAPLPFDAPPDADLTVTTGSVLVAAGGHNPALTIVTFALTNPPVALVEIEAVPLIEPFEIRTVSLLLYPVGVPATVIAERCFSRLKATVACATLTKVPPPPTEAPVSTPVLLVVKSRITIDCASR